MKLRIYFVPQIYLQIVSDILACRNGEVSQK